MQGAKRVKPTEVVRRKGDGDQLLRFVLGGAPVIVRTYAYEGEAADVFVFAPDQLGRDLAEEQWRETRRAFGEPLEVRECAQCGYDLTDTMGVNDGTHPLRCLVCHTVGRVPNHKRFFEV